MTAIEPRPVAGAGLFVRFVYWFARRKLGRVPRPIGVMAHHRGVLAAAGAFEMGIARGHVLDRRLVYLAGVRAAMCIGCRFCIDIGSALARRAGVSQDELAALVDPARATCFDALDRDVLAYAEQMTATPAAPDRALFQRLRARLGEAGLVELTAEIAWENFRARFNHAVGAVEEGFEGSVVCLLPARDADHTHADGLRPERV